MTVNAFNQYDRHMLFNPKITVKLNHLILKLEKPTKIITSSTLLLQTM